MMSLGKEIQEAVNKVHKSLEKSNYEAKATQKGMDLIYKQHEVLDRALKEAAKTADPNKLKLQMAKISEQINASAKLQQSLMKQQQAMQVAQKVLEAQHDAMVKAVKNMK